MTEWSVYYNHFFLDENEQRLTPGREIPLNKEFIWGNQKWKVLSVYICTEGIIMDLYREIDREKIQKFNAKWDYFIDHEEELTEDQIISRAGESPFAAGANMNIEINGQSSNATETSYLYCDPFDEIDYAMSDTVLQVADHYSLDLHKVWQFSRGQFPWPGEPIQEIEKMQITLEAEFVPVLGTRFTVQEEGKKIHFSLPFTEEAYTLEVLALRPATFDFHRRKTEEYPSHCLQLFYDISPALSDDIVSIKDCCQGDSPHMGQFGFCSDDDMPGRFACSSLYFESPEHVEWCMIFEVKTREDYILSLLPGRDF